MRPSPCGKPFAFLRHCGSAAFMTLALMQVPAAPVRAQLPGGLGSSQSGGNALGGWGGVGIHQFAPCRGYRPPRPGRGILGFSQGITDYAPGDFTSERAILLQAGDAGGSSWHDDPPRGCNVSATRWQVVSHGFEGFVQAAGPGGSRPLIWRPWRDSIMRWACIEMEGPIA